MRTLLALALLTVPLTACKTKLDHEKLEKAIRSETEGKDWPVKSVSCPEGREAKEGDSFECTLTFNDGQKLPVVVDVQDAQGNIKWKTKSKIVPIKKVQKNIAAAVEKKVGHEVTIDCEHHEVVILREDEEVTCDLESEKHDGAKIVINITNDDGDVKWKIKD